MTPAERIEAAENAAKREEDQTENIRLYQYGKGRNAWLRIVHKNGEYDYFIDARVSRKISRERAVTILEDEAEIK